RFKHRMRRAALGQGGSGDRCKADRLADEPPSGLLEHQGQLRQAETESVSRGRHQHSEPPDLASLAQSLQREAWILLAKCSCHLRTRRLNEFDGAVAQEGLLR